jgi:hypothetical protein
LKWAAGLLLVILLGVAGWILSHWQKIRCELINDEALPKPAPHNNIFVLLTVVTLALASLLVAYIFS